jgi:hypothetical protein
VVDDRYAEIGFGPLDGVRIRTLTGQKKNLELDRSYFFMISASRVLALDGPECRGRGEHGLTLCWLITRQNTPASGVPTGLPSKENRGAPLSSGRVNDVGVADHPAHVGCRPVNVAGIDVVNGLHRPFQRHHVPPLSRTTPLGWPVVPEV